MPWTLHNNFCPNSFSQSSAVRLQGGGGHPRVCRERVACWPADSVSYDVSPPPPADPWVRSSPRQWTSRHRMWRHRRLSLAYNRQQWLHLTDPVDVFTVDILIRDTVLVIEMTSRPTKSFPIAHLISRVCFHKTLTILICLFKIIRYSRMCYGKNVLRKRNFGSKIKLPISDVRFIISKTYKQ